FCFHLSSSVLCPTPSTLSSSITCKKELIVTKRHKIHKILLSLLCLFVAISPVFSRGDDTNEHAVSLRFLRWRPRRNVLLKTFPEHSRVDRLLRLSPNGLADSCSAGPAPR